MKTKWYIPVNSEDTLNIMRRIPGRIENDDPVSGDQIDAQTTGTGRNEKQAGAQVGWVVENIAPISSQFRSSRSIQTEVVCIQMPATKCHLKNKNKSINYIFCLVFYIFFIFLNV